MDRKNWFRPASPAKHRRGRGSGWVPFPKPVAPRGTWWVAGSRPQICKVVPTALLEGDDRTEILMAWELSATPKMVPLYHL